MTSGSTRAYIILSDSSGSGKRYKATELRQPIIRTDTIENTLGGGLDKQSGATYHQKQYALRVPLDTPQDGVEYGTYDDLAALFELVNPNGTPTDVITLSDHWNVDHFVYFVGNLDPESMTTMLEGPSAYFIVPVQFIEIPT